MSVCVYLCLSVCLYVSFFISVLYVSVSVFDVYCLLCHTFLFHVRLLFSWVS